MSLKLTVGAIPQELQGGILRIASCMDKAGGAISMLSYALTYDEWNSWSVQILKEICRSV